MNRTSCTLAVVAVLAALPSVVQATTDTADLRYSAMAHGDSTSYSFLLNGNSINTPAGALEIEIRDGSAQGNAVKVWNAATPMSSSDNRVFNTFCIELAQNAGMDFAPYLMVPLDQAPGGAAMGVTRATQLAYLWETHLADANTAPSSAAFQAAVWEIVNETQGYSLEDGVFQMTDDSAVRTLAQTWLAEVALADLSQYEPTLTFTALHNPDYQDYVFAYEDTPSVPEPASMAAVGCGLAGLVGYLRKRRRR